jgi:hypothetical protein
MSEETQPDTPPAVSVDKLVKVYLKMNAKLTEIKAAFDAQEKELKSQMAKVKSALLAHCKEQNVEGAKTAEGLFYRSVTTRYWTNNWEAMGKFVVEHNVPELLEKRLHQGNTKQFLEEHPELLPPGLNVDSEYTITVRKK